ncbi:hypothetical protein O6H91_22G049900 [Diphasiastrum complanatum]|uniref:Uncharacterized protein n=1 Tax=Diphasiastrum complanatum TaxID=34168 RepID=A0ACC2AFL1_DIPCM|nr:hypothetical protein O6H91_22G049900 [Diphasiastrum complanatum]
MNLSCSVLNLKLTVLLCSSCRLSVYNVPVIVSSTAELVSTMAEPAKFLLSSCILRARSLMPLTASPWT